MNEVFQVEEFCGNLFLLGMIAGMVSPIRFSMNLKFFCMAFLMMAIPGRIAAYTGEEDDENWHHCVGVTGELTPSTAWQLEGSYHWFPVRYVGVGASVGFWKQIGGDVPATNDWSVREDSQNAMNLFVTPSLLFQTPALVKTEDVKIGLMAEPGLMLNVPYDKVYIERTHGTGIPLEYDKVSSHKGAWPAFNFRVGAYSSFGRIGVALGYVWSNLDIYAIRRNMVYENVRFNKFYPKRKYCGGMFVRISAVL